MQGWASFYDFNFSDVRSGADVVAANCGDGQPDWNKLRGLLENAIYGGRVDNARDVQVCQSFPFQQLLHMHQRFTSGPVGSGQLQPAHVIVCLTGSLCMQLHASS